LWNLASTERKLGRHVDALRHLRAYVQHTAARADRKQVAVTDLIPELELAVARITFQAPPGTRLTVDGVPNVGTEIEVEPGIHTVVATLNNDERSLAVDAPAGVTTTTTIAFAIAAPPEALAPTPAVVAPVIVAPLAPSTSKKSSTATRNWTVLGLGATGVIAIGAGVVFAALASDDRSEAERLYTRMRDDDASCKRSGSLCSDHDSARSGAQRNEAISTSMFVTGGVLSGAAIAAWILWPNASTHVTPAASKDAAFVNVTGRF